MNRLSLLILLLFSLKVSNAQRYSFVNYTALDGLSQDFVYTILQGENGNLVIGTGEGISVFDGKKFKNYSTKNGLAENVITTAYKDDNGIFYFGHNEGGITVVEDFNFKSIKRQTTSKSNVTGITKTEQGIIFCTQNDGLFLIKNDNKAIHLYKRKDLLFYSLIAISDNDFLLGTSEGVLRFTIKNNSISISDKFLTEYAINVLYKNPYKDEILLSANSIGLYKIKTQVKNSQPTRLKFDAGINWSNFIVSSILVDYNNDIWVSSLYGGVTQISMNKSTVKYEAVNYNDQNGFNSNFVKSLFEDHEGNIWIGSFGNGLSRHLKTNFTIYTSYGEIDNFHPYSILTTDKGVYYGLTGKIVYVDNNDNKKVLKLPNELASDKITSLSLGEENIWIGTEKSGVYSFTKDSACMKMPWELTSLEKYINDLELIDNTLWIATEGALMEYDITTKSLDKYGTESGLPHNNISALTQDADKSLFIGTKSNSLLRIKNGELFEIKITEKGVIQIVDILIVANNNYYLATSENGVIHFTSDEISSYNDLNGLKSNYCYSIGQDINGNIWVGHTNGLSKINPGSIEVFDMKEGITGRSNFRCITSDFKGNVLIGTSNSLAKYDTHKDLDLRRAPKVSITSLLINNAKKSLTNLELSADYYQVTFNFNGISFKNPDGVRFKYKLEGYDFEYSPLSTNRFASYGKLGPGEYTFKLVACNEDGVCSEEIVSQKIYIDNFFWQKPWFYLLIIVGLVLILLATLRIRTHTLKQRQILLEEEIELKTKEIVKQKDKIEDINKDLTDSINYAEKIQKRILPEVNLLTENLPGSFVYFRPRDIVSGDFYFFHETKESIIIAVADCTGHGVPGAFMSFIGSVSLRNIYSNFKITQPNPSEALFQLDYEVEAILKQREILDELDYFKTRDGMDVTICEINKSTRKAKVSSAMRPFVIVKDGETEIFKGNRNSIGGGNISNKSFELHEIQLNKGDQIYLFSDGLTDQFGGPQGKKLKVEGVIEMLNHLDKTNSNKNQKYVEEFFENWLTDYLQLDDVLLIAIQL